MISTKHVSIGLVAALVAILPAMPAQAAGRTFVSTAGSDSNPCTIALPCRNLQAAYYAVAVNGEIDVLDPGNYGSLVISAGVNIQGHGWAGLSANTGAAITIMAPDTTAKISISGVVLDGLGIAGTTGIRFNSGGSLSVRNSEIRNFVDGIDFLTSTSAATQISVSNTLIADNLVYGINISPTGAGPVSGVIDHVDIQNSSNTGLNVSNTTGIVNVTVTDSVVANGVDGILANSSGLTLLNIMVRNSSIINNSSVALGAQDNGANLRVTRSSITGNHVVYGLFGTGTPQVTSYSDNNIDGNTTNAPPASTLIYH